MTSSVSNGSPRQTDNEGARTTILVVEDEASVREMASLALVRAGFGVLQASNGEAALAQLDTANAVGAVLSDVQMPTMGGLELAKHLARTHPALPVILMSGRGISEIDALDTAPRNTATIPPDQQYQYVDLDGQWLPFVRKPFDVDDLIATVERSLTRAASDEVTRLRKQAGLVDSTPTAPPTVATDDDDPPPAWEVSTAGWLAIRHLRVWMSGSVPAEELASERAAIRDRLMNLERASASSERKTAPELTATDQPESWRGLANLLTTLLEDLGEATPTNMRQLLTPLFAYARAMQLSASYELAVEAYELLLYSRQRGNQADHRGHHTTRPNNAELAGQAALRLGACYRLLCRVSEAREAYQRAKALARECGAEHIIFGARLGEAMVVFDRGNFPAADAALVKIIQDAPTDEFKSIRADAWHNRAAIAYKCKRPADAAIFAHEAWCLRTNDDPVARDRLLLDLATFMDAAGRHTAARHANQAVYHRTVEVVAKWHAAVNLLDLAITMRDEPEFDHFHRVLAAARLSPNIEVEFLYTLGLGYRAFGRRTEATAILKNAQAKAKQHTLNELLFRIGDALNDPTPRPAALPPEPATGAMRRVEEMCLGAARAAAVRAT